MMAGQTRWLFAPALMALMALGCGGSARSAPRTPQAEARGADWTPAQLSKLDPDLRMRVREGEGARIPIKVFFNEMPTDDELSALLLNRMGHQAIGSVEPETLHRIAERGDVERIEGIRDVGYDSP